MRLIRIARAIDSLGDRQTAVEQSRGRLRPFDLPKGRMRQSGCPQEPAQSHAAPDALPNSAIATFEIEITMVEIALFPVAMTPIAMTPTAMTPNRDGP